MEPQRFLWPVLTRTLTGAATTDVTSGRHGVRAEGIKVLLVMAVVTVDDVAVTGVPMRGVLKPLPLHHQRLQLREQQLLLAVVPLTENRKMCRPPSRPASLPHQAPK